MQNASTNGVKMDIYQADDNLQRNLQCIIQTVLCSVRIEDKGGRAAKHCALILYEL